MQNALKENTPTHSLPDWAYQMAPCLADSPYIEEARHFIAAGLELEDNSYAGAAKMMVAYQIAFYYRWMERNSQDDPIPQFKDFLKRCTDFMIAAKNAEPPFVYPMKEENYGDAVAKTAKHYGDLFSEFDREYYIEEPKKLLGQRLERNGFDLSKFPEWTALDAGCGGGRYAVALKNLGMKKVHAIDISEINLNTAQKRKEEFGTQDVEFQQANVLDIPFEDNTFDFVFSNGVLHHTVDCAKGIKELVRVMKPGACGHLNLMCNPGGIHWDSIELCRILLKDLPVEFCHSFFRILNIPANLRYLYLDHMMVPINVRYTAKECEKMLEAAGAKNIRRLIRGADVDREERAYAGEKYIAEKYGECNNRFYFEK